MGYSFKAILDFIEFSEDDEFFSEIGDFDLSKSEVSDWTGAGFGAIRLLLNLGMDF